MFTKTVAEREKVKLMIGLTGPSGSGKTYSALQLAYGITGDWKKIALVDTENKSSLYYAGEKTGEWQHIDFPPTIPGGYHPTNWIKAIEYVESDKDIQVLILDSISHEWNATGGSLDLQTKFGGKFQDWAKVTPLHNAFVDKMRHSRLHIIATMRSKQDYAVEQNEKGKSTPRKVGLAPVQREGTDYEFGIILDIQINHYCEASKDRTGIFAGRGPFQITADTGKELLTWANQGKSVAPKSQNPSTFSQDNPKHMEWFKATLKKRNITLDADINELVPYVVGKTVMDINNEIDKIVDDWNIEKLDESDVGLQ